MNYWVHGVDAISQQLRDPLFVEGAGFQEAWQKAAADGMDVSRIELAGESERPNLPETSTRIPGQARQFEFDGKQNHVFATLAFYMKFVGIFLFAAAFVLVAQGILHLVGREQVPPIGGTAYLLGAPRAGLGVPDPGERASTKRFFGFCLLNSGRYRL